MSEEVASLQAQIDQLTKRNRELEEQLAGHIPQVSSAPLHNYPDASVDLPQPEPEEAKTKQPRTGASATASEK